MTTPALVATCWTHAGPPRTVGGTTVSGIDITDRARAVAAAGFVGLGFTLEDLLVARETISWPDLKRLLDDLGLVHVEVELLMDWWTTGARRAASDAKRALLLEAAAVFDSPHIKIAPDAVFGEGLPVPPPPELERWAAELHDLAGQAAAAGTRVALEVLPISNIADFTQASALITAAEHPAAGLCVDIWHLERGPSTLADLAAVPGAQIFCVELNDAAQEVVGGLYYDTMHHRKLCGDGSFDVRGLIRTLQDNGFHGPWGVEIISDEHYARPLPDALAAVVATTTAQFG